MQNLERNWLVVSKLTWGIWQIFTKQSKVSKIFNLMGFFWAKYILFELKKYGGDIFHDTEEWCKSWRKTDLWFKKWQEEFDKFSLEHLKVSKLGLSWDPFIQSRDFMRLKFIEELRAMTMKNNGKFGEELTCCYKINMRNLTNFDLSTWKSQNCAL